MKLGLQLSGQHSIGDSMIQRLEEHLEQVRVARKYGFDSVFASQHYLATYQYLHSVPFLARIAAEAGDMEVGASVIILPLHHPVEVAEQIATLDIICNGRFIFGVGLGYRDVEFEAIGIPMDQRVSRFIEGLQLIKRLWTEDKVTFEGKHYQLRDVTMTIRPVQKPYPPVWIAANNDPAVRRAARMGDVWLMNPHATFATLVRQIQLYKEALQESGKPFPRELPTIKELYVAEDRDTALRDAWPYLESKYKEYVQWGQDRALPKEETFDLPFKELVGERFILGSPQDCIEQIQRHYEVLGINHFMLRIQWPGMPQSKVLRAIKLLGEKVIPYFKG